MPERILYRFFLKYSIGICIEKIMLEQSVDRKGIEAVSYTHLFAMEHSKEGVRAAASCITKRVEPVLEKLIRAKGKIEEVI